jgi:purine-cytosine permease-like protein
MTTAEIGSDDYALSRVPGSARYGFGPMLLQWLARSGSLSQFVLGATLGAAGRREGLNTTLLARFAGFGRNGTALVSLVIGIGLVGWFGVQNGSDVTHIVIGTSGFAGLIIVVPATAKINDWNLYGSSLGVVNFTQAVFGKRLHRGLVTVVIGVLGTVLSAIGFLDHFKDFLSLLGVAIPPVGGIIVASTGSPRSASASSSTGASRR